MPQPIDTAALHLVLLNSSVNHAMQHVGDRWTLSILLRAFLGTSRFDDFQQQLGIPRQTLSVRLKALVELGMLRTRPYQEHALRLEYRLTGMGLAMYPCVLMSWRWEKRWGRPSVALPDRLTHRTCGHQMTPQMVCAHCRAEVLVEDVMPSYNLDGLRNATDVDAAPPGQPARARRWAGQALSEGKAGQSQENIVELLNDRWVLLLLAAVMVGCHTYDALQAVLGIGSSVLAARLKMLSNTGMLSREASRDDARRFVYRLTPRSRDLFSYIATLGYWARSHLPGCPDSLRLVHRSCGAPLVPTVVCDRCEVALLPQDVSYPGRS